MNNSKPNISIKPGLAQGLKTKIFGMGDRPGSWKNEIFGMEDRPGNCKNKTFSLDSNSKQQEEISVLENHDDHYVYSVKCSCCYSYVIDSRPDHWPSDCKQTQSAGK